MRFFATLLITITISFTARAYAPEIHITNAFTTTPEPSRLVSFNGNLANNKVILNWVIAENQAADKFEIEKSTNGKTFSLAALVFGTDLAETANYQFYEKAGAKKTYYRLKIVDKNNSVSYSNVLTIDATH